MEEVEANLRSFLQWAAALGISDSPHAPSSSCLGHTLCVAHFPHAGGRGLAAARAIRKGELVLRVPKPALMTTDCLIEKDPNFSLALAKFPSLSSTQLSSLKNEVTPKGSGHTPVQIQTLADSYAPELILIQILSVALLNEVNKGKSSSWYTYLKQLPRSYHLLASFSQFEIDALQIDDAISTAETSVQECKREWEEVTPLMGALNLKVHLVTFSAWFWAYATISSRTMHISWDAAGCLCPVGDFINYTPPEEESQPSDNSNDDRLVDAEFDEGAGSYCFYAKTDYKKGDQVLVSYGTYTNLELLQHYGFLLQENPNNKAYISLEPEMYSLCSWSKDSLCIDHDGKPSFALLSTIRLWATPERKRKSVKQMVYSGGLVSTENEHAVMEWIMKACEALLESYPTSIAEDSLLLSIIENIHDYKPADLEYGELSTTVHNEICGFLESSSAMRGEVPSSMPFSVKSSTGLIDRWKLAVEWRMNYKRILSDCISYCHKMLDNA